MERVAGGSTYQVEVSASSSFATILYKATTANRQVVPTAQLPAGTVWWRVRAVNSSSQAGPWATAPLGRSQVDGPALLSPAAGAGLVQPTNPPLLSWVPSVERPATRSRSTPPKATSSDRPCTRRGPRRSSSPTRRRTARTGGGFGHSRKRPLDEVVERTQLHGRSSADGERSAAVQQPRHAGRGRRVRLGPVPGAISYDVRVSEDDSFNKIIDTQVVKGTRYSEMVTYNNDQYWWQVRARNIFGKAQEWDEVPIRSFQRHWPEAPQIVHPTLTEVERPRSRWGRPLLPVDARPEGDAVPPAVRNGPQLHRYPEVRGLLHDPDQLRPGFVKSPVDDKCMPRIGATTYWRVQALDGKSSPEVNGVFSTTSKFIYNPGAVSQTSPLQDATVDVPTLRWARTRTRSSTTSRSATPAEQERHDVLDVLDPDGHRPARSHQGALHLDRPGCRPGRQQDHAAGVRLPDLPPDR